MSSRVRTVSQGKFDTLGVYLWEMPNGAYVCDENRNFLSIASQYGDITRINRLAAYAKMIGVPEGKAVFFPGQRKVSDEEYAEQQDRLKNGLIPDEYDLPAHIEDHRDRR